MYHVSKVDWSFADSPMPDSHSSSGLARTLLIGRPQGAVHTELVVGALHPGGWLNRHMHSFEEALYLLSGELMVEIDGHAHRLVAGDYTLHPIGTFHALANDSSEQARFLAVSTPQRLAPDAGRRDTFYVRESFEFESFAERAARPAFGSPSLRYVGHYDGTPPQAEALALSEPARGRRPIGADVALLAYSGISVKMLVDRVFGADQLTMFTVDYEVRGAAQAHDHPFEETYFFLAGEVEAELDGVPHTLRPGDVVFAGVGSTHGFWNEGPDRVRWIETQAPQPPARNSYRWSPIWKKLEDEYE